MRAPRESSRTDRLEMHREKMRNKAHRRTRMHAACNTPGELEQARGNNTAFNRPNLARWDRRYGSIATINRWGKLHKDAREIARRNRHANRDGMPR